MYLRISVYASVFAVQLLWKAITRVSNTYYNPPLEVKYSASFLSVFAIGDPFVTEKAVLIQLDDGLTAVFLSLTGP